MIELRPTCEYCNSNLPANSTDAMICSFECTFCKECVDNILYNVCPNCGGGFTKRPIRPSENHKNENYLGKYPASTVIKHKPVNIEQQLVFSNNIKSTPVNER